MRTLTIISFLLFMTCADSNTHKEKIKTELTHHLKNKTQNPKDHIKFIDLDLGLNTSTIKKDTLIKYWSNKQDDTPIVVIDKQSYYQVEGDLLMTENDYLNYRRLSKTVIDTISSFDEKMIGYRRNNVIQKQPEHLNMKYAIIKQSFNGNISQYEKVKKCMLQATKDWQGMCNVKFTYVSDLDDKLDRNDNPDSLTFIIKKETQGSTSHGAFAFLPHDKKNKRKLLIYSRFFTGDYDKTGVLRHEIGHILGFLHERIIAPKGICRQPNFEYDLFITEQYNPTSVMHLFCNGVGDKSLKFTKVDSLVSSSNFYYPFN